MLSINTNTSSLITQNSLNTSTNKLNQAIERMTTGAKINHAKDNAANYSIATDMTTKINAYQIAEDNCAMGLDYLKTASDTLSVMTDLTTRLRVLATQAKNGTFDSKSLDAIQQEADSTIAELQRISTKTEYNGINVLIDTSAKAFIDQIIPSSTSSATPLSSIDPDTVTLLQDTYTISTAEDLVLLGKLCEEKKVDYTAKFILTNDIDLSNYSDGEGWEPIMNFTGTFDGNGHKIKNLYINRNEQYQGLFGKTGNLANIKNLGLENANVTGSTMSGGLVGYLYFSRITNCYVTGNFTGPGMGGGLVGYSTSSFITDCYSETDINALNNYSRCGSLVGYCYATEIVGSYSTGTVKGVSYIGGLIGEITGPSSISNCYATGKVEGNAYKSGVFAGCIQDDATVKNCYFVPESSGITAGDDKNLSIGITRGELNELINQNSLKLNGQFSQGARISIQAGTNSSINSQISLTICGTSVLKLTGLKMNDPKAIKILDDILDEINEQQTNIGASENKLMSALEQIHVSYDNLISSRSTIKDADIAEVSSEYIKMQILQQASATLMATANQSPAVALQLL